MECLHALRAWGVMFQNLEAMGISLQDIPAQVLIDACRTLNSGGNICARPRSAGPGIRPRKAPFETPFGAVLGQDLKSTSFMPISGLFS